MVTPHIGTTGNSIKTTTGTSVLSTGSQSGQSVLLVQLTDPPVVPTGTTILNLTYNAITLLVSEPTTQSGVVTTQTVKITPSGGSASVNLLKLQNVSETLASAALPNDSVIYSVDFNITNISITINGTVNQVTLATGGSTLLVTLAQPSSIKGTNAMLVDLTPTVVNTTSGYQMIPSAVGIIRPQANLTLQEQQVGHQSNLTSQDQQDLHHAMGQISASLVSMSVSGNITTISVEVNNTGNATIALTAVGIHGNFTAQTAGCSSTNTQQTNDASSTSTQSQDNNDNSSSTTTSSSSTNHDIANSGLDHAPGCYSIEGISQFVFFPNSTVTTPSSGCATGTMAALGLGAAAENQQGGLHPGDHLKIAAGECVILTFSSTISVGNHGIVVLPSTSAGQQYNVQVIATNSAETMLNCTLPTAPATTASCTPIHNNFGDSSGNGNGDN